MTSLGAPMLIPSGPRTIWNPMYRRFPCVSKTVFFKDKHRLASLRAMKTFFTRPKCKLTATSASASVISPSHKDALVILYFSKSTRLDGVDKFKSSTYETTLSCKTNFRSTDGRAPVRRNICNWCSKSCTGILSSRPPTASTQLRMIAVVSRGDSLCPIHSLHNARKGDRDV